MATANQSLSSCNFEEWMKLQAEDLAALDRGLEQHSHSEQHLTQLAENVISHFEDYMQRRTQLAQKDVSGFLAPLWCATIELPLLWIGGCRPSSYMRLIYAMSGSEFLTKLEDLSGNITSSNDLGGISDKQLLLIDSLRRKTIREEDRLSAQLASLQEDIADQPLALIANRFSQIGMMNDEVEKALEQHEVALLALMKEADQLRLKTLKELMQILTPLQAVSYLAASKKLHLALHEWGKQRSQTQNQTSHSNQLA